jgi:molybdopterin converting factor subunit 1
MRVKMLYFAVVRELCDCAEESLELPPGVLRIAELSRHLEARHPALSGQLDAVRFAVNETFAARDGVIADGDVVAVIPPVAGG